MPYIIKVDKQGRLVLPKEVREKAGIKENSQLIYTVIGGDRTHPII
ncbi:MAG: AbrB/MazE/SpoVT family DNA-binding domain-containing protein [Thermoprotei archaeon]|nr:AbrB/MazE/SpoVT family DNA-binding domain-containing protein [Thermoprotei archaeon]